MHGTSGTPSPVGGTDGAAAPRLEPIFVSVDDAALALSLSRREVYRLMDDGAIEDVSRGRRRLVVVESLWAFAKRLREEAAARRTTAPAA